jgi:hypothetical protein
LSYCHGFYLMRKEGNEVNHEYMRFCTQFVITIHPLYRQK